MLYVFSSIIILREFEPNYEPIIKSWKLGDPPTDKKKAPVIFSAAWFRSKSPNKFLPPRLQYAFPINLVCISV